MAGFEFVIPLRREDLLRVGRTCDYSVDEVLTVREISSRINGSLESLFEEGPAVVADQFDLLYSCLCQFLHLDVEIRVNVWNAVLKAMNSLTSELSLLLDDQDSVDSEMQQRTLNILKMNCYILSQLTILFEDGATKAVTDVVVATGKGRSKLKKKTTHSTADWNWTEEKQTVVLMIRDLMMLPLHKLWTPPVIEEEFLNLFCNCCYKMLENGMINRMKELKDSIFNLLGIIIKKNKNTIGIAVKITQMLQQFEHLAIPLAQAMIVFVRDHNIKNVLNEIIREIGTMDAKDLSVDSVGTRSFSSFLVEIAEHMPSLILSNISILATHLDGEFYTMRNCVLGIMGEIVLQTMGRDEIDERTRIIRDTFLDNLENHLLDTNAFVRSRALQIWTKLFQEKVVPIARQQQLLELVVGRLEDKSASVRKYSTVLLTTILKSNPFAAKLSLEDLKDTLEKEKAKLEKMQPGSGENFDACDGVRTRSKSWTVNATKLKQLLETELSRSRRKTIDRQMSYNVILDLRSFIDAGEYKKAVSIFLEAQSEIYSRSDDETSSDAMDAKGDANNSGGDETSSDAMDAKGDADNSGGDETSSDAMDAKGDADNSGDLVVDEALNSMRIIYIGTNDETERLNNGRQQTGSPNVVASNGFDCSEEAHQNLPDDVLKQKVLVHYLKDSINFAEVVSRAIPLVCQLLGSSHTTDVLTSIEFFVLVYEFGVQDAVVGIQRMLTLIFSKEATVKNAVVGAYKRLYLIGSNDVLRPSVIVNNIINLIKRLTLGQLTSLEEMICEFVKAGEIGTEVLDHTWDLFANRNGQFLVENSNASVILLRMAAGANSDIIKENLQLLVTVGLGERATNNFQFARDVCIALLKLAGNTKSSVESVVTPLRMPMNHIIFPRLVELLATGLDNDYDEMWTPLAVQAVNVIYKLAEHPDMICEEMLIRIVKNMLSSNADSNETPLFEETIQCRPIVLARFVVLCGHVALYQMIHLDVNVFCELKRRQCLEEKEAMKKKVQKAKTKNKRQRGSTTANSFLTSKGKDVTMDDDDGCLTGADADDAGAEFIRKVCDTELVMGLNLLALVVPVIITIVSNPGQYANSKLQAAASLALAKYMMVSSDFCDSQLQLLFTILEKSTDISIRANTIVALGDLSCRFPNLIEPWTSHLYGRLRDESFRVRRNALVVLTHLILHDMVKVKGQISDLALCVVDPDKHISDLAKMFFQELSQKGNSIYNLLPDIISRLSDVEVGTTEENFQTVMKFLLPFVQKDRLLENLVEKLLHRFSATRSERQWRNLAFCISLLCLNERCYAKLLENLSFFADKLMEPKVYDYFSSIVVAAKKNVKPDYQAVIDELHDRIEEFHNKGVDDEAIVNKASQVVENIGKHKRQKASRPSNARREVGLQRPKSTAKLQVFLDSSDEDEEVPKSSRRSRIQQTARTPLLQAKVKKAFRFSSDSDDDDDGRDVWPTSVKNKKGGTRRSEDVKSDSNGENSDPNSQSRSKNKRADLTARRVAKNRLREVY